MNGYVPRPINTENINLPVEIQLLVEKLAANVHDIWADERIKNGWSFGESRDDVKKTTPCLIPYDSLPEDEKVYDRNSVMETIKALYSMGYRIVKAE